MGYRVCHTVSIVRRNEWRIQGDLGGLTLRFFACQFENSSGPAFSGALTPHGVFSFRLSVLKFLRTCLFRDPEPPGVFSFCLSFWKFLRTCFFGDPNSPEFFFSFFFVFLLVSLKIPPDLPFRGALKPPSRIPRSAPGNRTSVYIVPWSCAWLRRTRQAGYHFPTQTCKSYRYVIHSHP